MVTGNRRWGGSEESRRGRITKSHWGRDAGKGWEGARAGAKGGQWCAAGAERDNPSLPHQHPLGGASISSSVKWGTSLDRGEAYLA